MLHAVVADHARFTPELQSQDIVYCGTCADGSPIVASTPPESLPVALGDTVRADRDGPLTGTTTGPYPLAIFRCSGQLWKPALTVHTDLVHPFVQMLADGSALIVGRHCRRHADGSVDDNAVIFARDGSQLARFHVGDGIGDVQVGAADAIWVAYTDQGTTGDFGRLGWGRVSRDTFVEPVGRSGLVRFDRQGRRQQQFTPPADRPVIADCYALNVVGHDAWACYHPGFGLAWLGPGAEARMRSTGLHGIDAVAVHRSRVMLYRGYGLRPHVGWLGNLAQDRVEDLVPLSLALPDDPAEDSRRVVGRGSSLHVFTRESWTRFAAPFSPA